MSFYVCIGYDKKIRDGPAEASDDMRSNNQTAVRPKMSLNREK